MRVLALDVATKTGWALQNGPSGVWNLKPGKGDSAGVRFLKFWAKLNEALAAAPDVTLIVYEQPISYKSGQTDLVLKGLIAHLLSWVETWNREHPDRPLEYMAVNTATLKAHATGKGNAGKPMMMAAAKKRGWEPEDDNHADALFLLDYALVEVVGRAAHTRSEGAMA